MFFKKNQPPPEPEVPSSTPDKTEEDCEFSSVYDTIEPMYDIPKGNVILNRVLFRSEHYILIELDPLETCMRFENIIIHTNTIKSATLTVYTDDVITYDDYVCTTFNGR